MKKVFAEKSAQIVEYPGSHSWELFAEGTTPCRGYRAMYNLFYNGDYIVPYGVHTDHEGFYVVSGTGKMVIGTEEFDLAPGVSMLAPANVPHAIKKTSEEVLHLIGKRTEPPGALPVRSK